MDLQDKPDNFTSVYARALPKRERAKVPLLEFVAGEEGDPCPLPIAESMVVLEYLHDLDGTNLLSAREKATARLFAQMMPQWLSFIPLLRADNEDAKAEALQALLEGMDAADEFLRTHGSEEGPFVAGDRFSLAEMATAPFVLRFLVILPGLRPEFSPFEMLQSRGLDRLSTWMDAVRSRPSCTASLPPAEQLVEGYKKLLARMAAASA